MQDFEKLGYFYFGKEYDLDAGETTDDLVLYDAKDLCTHAVCVGMTGSGKTGLCLSLLEEAAIDGIPAICIDPKGDLGNLMLSFPNLDAADFEPWVDPAIATRKGMSVGEFAESTADLWKNGLAEWGQEPSRIQKFKDAADVTIYTPASRAGIPITVLRSFNAPAEEIRDDREAMRERVMSAVSGLLALMQIDADPLSSREHILLSNILSHAWNKGRDVDMATMIREIQQPPFDKVGVMDVDSFFPAKDRFALSMQLNNLLASPGFQAWMEGEPLDIQRMFYTPEGKPRLAIVSIAHLSDSERMFFVTILLNEVLSWMRAQPGTSSLRALLYMDEVFGYFPPTANPPSKQPMLTLLKQARAFGLGCVLATQNPVDLDYKGLSNCGTWFLGRLQTERDKMRVMEGLEGASASAGATFDKQRMEQILAGLGSRVFLMNNVHDDEPVVFHTRWVLSYLRGPMTRAQIQTLMQDQRENFKSTANKTQSLGKKAAKKARPVLPPGIEEVFFSADRLPDDEEKLIYRPAIFGNAKLHYAKSSLDLDVLKEVCLLQPIGKSMPDETWEDSEIEEKDDQDFEAEPEDDAQFADLPSELTKKTNYTRFKTDLKNFLYRNYPLNIMECDQLDEVSKPGESEGDFRARLRHASREKRDLVVEKLRKKYAPKIDSANERIRKAQQRVEREKAEQKQATLSTAISVGSSILGALFGRKVRSVSNVSRAGSAARAAGRAAKQREDVAQARDTVDAYIRKMEDLENEFHEEIDRVTLEYDTANLELETQALRPRKTDLHINRIALAWTPWIIDEDGMAEPAFEF